MSKSRNTKRNANPSKSAAPGRRLPRPVAVVLVVAIVAAGIFWWSKGRQSGAPPAAGPTTAVNATNPTASAPAANPGFDKLKGKWLRPDGGYIVDIQSVEPGGKMDAAYFNPRPIHVEKAVAIQEGALTKVFIELRDVNYPGSTYTLAHDTASDQLAGIYYQAAIKQQFEVVFERVK